MKVKQTYYKGDRYGDGERLRIEAAGRVISAGGGEPEDNTLGRDLSFAFEIVPLMKLAHEAGKRGEPLEVEETEAAGEES